MMPFTVGGVTWNVAIVAPDDPELVDWTGVLRVATTNPVTRTVNVSLSLTPPLLDMVMVHEAMHAIAESYGFADIIGNRLNEMTASMVEHFSLEAVEAASTSLGRPVCVRGLCK